jgi:hypothetical protein
MHGEHQYQSIRSDREARICKPDLFQIHASWGRRLVPGAADGITLQD